MSRWPLVPIGDSLFALRLVLQLVLTADEGARDLDALAEMRLQVASAHEDVAVRVALAHAWSRRRDHARIRRSRQDNSSVLPGETAGHGHGIARPWLAVASRLSRALGRTCCPRHDQSECHGGVCRCVVSHVRSSCQEDAGGAPARAIRLGQADSRLVSPRRRARRAPCAGWRSPAHARPWSGSRASRRGAAQRGAGTRPARDARRR